MTHNMNWERSPGGNYRGESSGGDHRGEITVANHRDRNHWGEFTCFDSYVPPEWKNAVIHPISNPPDVRSATDGAPEPEVRDILSADTACIILLSVGPISAIADRRSSSTGSSQLSALSAVASLRAPCSGRCCSCSTLPTSSSRQ